MQENASNDMAAIIKRRLIVLIVNITTFGNGHGVGMSQYGANELAKQGYRAEQIVAHYYPNTSLETISCPPPNSSE